MFIYMSLSIGRTVIHPHHGPVTVTEHMTRQLRGKPVEYVELLVLSSQMTISVPLKTVEDIGLRDVACATQLDRLADVLCAPTTEFEKSWARRMKAYSSKIITGEPLQIAQVVRDLMRRREEKGISMAEREMLRDGLAPLVAEVAIATGVTEEQAEQVISDMITTGERETLEQVPAA